MSSYFVRNVGFSHILMFRFHVTGAYLGAVVNECMKLVGEERNICRCLLN